MANADARPASAGFQDSAAGGRGIRQKGRAATRGVGGYARIFSHPAYENLLSSEDFLRRLVPVLIVLFLAVVGVARWVQINKFAEQIIDTNRAELHFIAELLEERISHQLDADGALPDEEALKRILRNTVAARYLGGHRQILVTGSDHTIVATVPQVSRYVGRNLHSLVGNAHLLTMFGRSASSREVVVEGDVQALAVHRILPDGLGGITLYQPKDPMMENWRYAVSTNVSLFVGTSSILLVILYAYFAQSARAREADSIYLLAQNRFETALDRGKCGLWDWDISRGRIYWSDSMFALLGMEHDKSQPDANILGFQKIAELIHPDDTSLYSVADLVLVEQADAIDKVFRMRHHNGQWLWTRIRAQVVYNRRGEPHLIGIAIDVTEQEKIRMRTRTISTRLHDAIENLSEAFVLWDHRKRLVMCNSKFQQLHGLKPQLAVPGVPYEELMEQAGNPLQGTEIIQGGKNSGNSRSYEVKLRDGRWLQFNERRTQDGGYVSVGNDITTIKRHEKQLINSELRQKATIADLKQSRQKLEVQARQLEELAGKHEKERTRAEEANQAKSDFLANMSHELRTPLNAIIGFSEIMQEEMFGALGSEKYREYCRDIHNSGAFLLGVINDILDMSKIEAGRFTLDFEPVSVDSLLEETLRIISREAAKKDIRIREEVRPGLEIEADRRAVKQILLNLLSNAVKFSSKGGEIFVRARIVSKCLRISIEDKGIGISRHDLSKLGRPFEQAQNQMTRDHKGSGLGLAISASLAHMHGGKLKIRSREGEGTIVSVQLPLSRTGVNKRKAKAAKPEEAAA
ncbi:sensor histidine kinase [Salaquimonas pukyongi]|uniref:sensor histidine kinase n=1 Tax=Salaquimonas pukyongi TaxID=2712698 RepID=UPI00096BCDF4|nr:ATP-binding protein [Salaquimonas pukyongi]